MSTVSFCSAIWIVLIQHQLGSKLSPDQRFSLILYYIFDYLSEIPFLLHSLPPFSLSSFLSSVKYFVTIRFTSSNDK